MTRRDFFSRAIGCALLALLIPDRLWAAQTPRAPAPTLTVAGDVNDIIVAATIAGKPLFACQGPPRIVAPKDSRGARSILMLEKLEVVRLRK